MLPDPSASVQKNLTPPGLQMHLFTRPLHGFQSHGGPFAASPVTPDAAWMFLGR